MKYVIYVWTFIAYLDIIENVTIFPKKIHNIKKLTVVCFSFQAQPAAAAAASAGAAKKGDWRKKREEFIAVLRAAKEAQRHVAAGGKLSDLPPPPPMDTSDYIRCPHCGRKFSESAADRHIPKCKDIKSNKR